MTPRAFQLSQLGRNSPALLQSFCMERDILAVKSTGQKIKHFSDSAGRLLRCENQTHRSGSVM